MLDTPAPNQFSVILVTAPSQSVAQQIAQLLVESRLAACVKLFPVQSVYTWNGAVQTEEEWQLLIKSQLAQFSALESAIRAVHPYDVPEIVAIPLQAGSAPYLEWIGATTTTASEV